MSHGAGEAQAVLQERCAVRGQPGECLVVAQGLFGLGFLLPHSGGLEEVVAVVGGAEGDGLLVQAGGRLGPAEPCHHVAEFAVAG